MLTQNIVNGIVAGSIYVIFAAGLTMVLGILDIPNFAYGHTFMIGAFTSFYLVSGLGLHFIVAMILSMIVVAAIGVVIEKVSFRPLRGSPHISLLISALALAIFLESLAALLFGNYNRSFISPYTNVVSFLGVNISFQRVLVVVISVVLIIALQVFIKRTKLGRAIRAMGQNPEAAQLMGVSIDKVSSFLFALCAALSAVAGTLLGSLFIINPSMGWEPLFKGVVILVVGGMGSVVGAIVGGLSLGIVESLTVQFLTSSYKSSIALLFLVIILMIKPTGIFGSQRGDIGSGTQKSNH